MFKDVKTEKKKTSKKNSEKSQTSEVPLTPTKNGNLKAGL